ncbi:MAG TPA: hypothetical protein PK580_08565 [Nitrosomonas halophila]|nr:hypothetical protein [Nitrosomonas halophila]
MTGKVTIDRCGEELAEIFRHRKMTVLLHGIALPDPDAKGERLQQQLRTILTAEGFAVAVSGSGRSEGLWAATQCNDAQNHPSRTYPTYGAVVWIAASPASLHELGWSVLQQVSAAQNQADLIGIIDDTIRGDRSGLDQAFVAAIERAGQVYGGDLANFDCSPIIQRLKQRRAVYFMDARGRPPGKGL